MLSWLTASSAIYTAIKQHTVLQINWIISFVHLIGEQIYFELNIRTLYTTNITKIFKFNL